MLSVFLYVVKADDPPLELPKIPSSLNEVWDKITGATKQEKSVSEPELPTIQVNDEDVIVAPEPKNESSVPEPQPVPAVEHDVCIPNPEAEIRTISSSWDVRKFRTKTKKKFLRVEIVQITKLTLAALLL